MNRKHVIGLLLLFTLPLFIQGVFDHPLWTNDEGFVAEIGREMFESNDVAIPRLAGEAFVEKPPLYYMAMYASYWLFGVTPGAARFPSAVFGFLTILATYFMVARLGNRRQGLISAVLLASTSMVFRISHWCVVDIAVGFFATMAFYTFLAGYQSDSHKHAWYLAFYVAVALAFMTKGLIVPVMIGIAIVSLLVWNRNLQEIGRMHILAGILIVSAFAVPWLYMLCQVGGVDLFSNFAIDNNIGRFCLTASNRYHEHARGPSFYFTNFLGNFLPWTPVFIPAVVWTFRQTTQSETPWRTFYRFLFAGVVVNVVLLSFSSTKRGIYLLPLYPLAVTMVGGWLDSLLNGRVPARWERVFIWFQVVLIALVPVILIGIGLYERMLPLMMSILLAFAFLGLAGVGFVALRRGNLGMVAANIGIQTVLIYTMVVWLVFPIISPYKQHVQFFDTLRAITRPGDMVAAYENVGEASLGQACISMNRVLPVIEGPQRAIRLLQSSGKRFLLVVEDGPRFDELMRLLGDQSKILYSHSLVNPLRPNRKRSIYCLSNR